jgi:hypothetical protein
MVFELPTFGLRTMRYSLRRALSLDSVDGGTQKT